MIIIQIALLSFHSHVELHFREESRHCQTVCVREVLLLCLSEQYMHSELNARTQVHGQPPLVNVENQDLPRGPSHSRVLDENCTFLGCCSKKKESCKQLNSHLRLTVMSGRA